MPNWNEYNVYIMKKNVFIVALCALVSAASAQETCFTELEGLKNKQIWEALFAKISNHTVLTYDEVRADRARVDFRVNNDNIWDMYSSCTFGSSDYCTNETSSGECSCYNREHIVPQSFWNDQSQPMRTDLYNVIPTDSYANEKRSSWPYGEVTGSAEWSNTLGSKLGYSSTFGCKVFEPADQYKGDFARAYFYMIACYYDKSFTKNANGREVFTYSNGRAGFTSTALTLFLKWHRNDPVSGKERRRNNLVEEAQGNRNPFVDAPELVEYIWGDKTNVAYQCATPIENVEKETPRVEKIIENGALIIVLPDGARYNTTGIRVY